jgi:hypothetical protein
MSLVMTRPSGLQHKALSDRRRDDPLRRLAAQKLAQEKPGQTLQATALVHEAYIRLVQSPQREQGSTQPHWDSRGHFFGAAAEAMRRILVDPSCSVRRC